MDKAKDQKIKDLERHIAHLQSTRGPLDPSSNSFHALNGTTDRVAESLELDKEKTPISNVILTLQLPAQGTAKKKDWQLTFPLVSHLKQLFIICLNIPFTILVFLARISGLREDEESMEKSDASSRNERRKQMRAADPALRLRAKAHDELNSRPRPEKRSPGGGKSKLWGWGQKHMLLLIAQARLINEKLVDKPLLPFPLEKETRQGGLIDEFLRV